MMRRALVDTALVALLLWGCVLPGQSGKKWSEQDFESALSLSLIHIFFPHSPLRHRSLTNHQPQA